jgi:hypothetical protein
LAWRIRARSAAAATLDTDTNEPQTPFVALQLWSVDPRPPLDQLIVTEICVACVSGPFVPWMVTV